MANIVIFGDSISQGAWDSEGGWADRIKRRFYKKSIDSNLSEYYEVYNLGRSGNTSTDLLKRFDNEMEVRVWENPITIVVFAIGINDSITIDGKDKVSEKDFTNNLEKLTSQAKKYTDKIVFVGLTPVDESKVFPMPWSTTEHCNNEKIKRYDALVKRVSKEHNLTFIEMFKRWQRLDYKNLLEDGLHPNTKGHELIYKTVSLSLDKLLNISE